MIESSGKDDITISDSNATEGNAKKLYFKAQDSKERDQWIKALLEALNKAPFGDLNQQSGI